MHSKQQTAITDRRVSSRWLVPGVRIQLQDIESKTTVTDISSNGIGITTNATPPLTFGTYVKLQVFFNDNPESIAIEGKVMRSTTNTGVGVLLTERKDIVKYRDALQASEKEPSNVRRHNSDRRQHEKALNPLLKNQRLQKDRRSTATIGRRIDMNGHAVDHWMARNRYLRRKRHQIMLGSNDYLGLTQHPKTKEAAIRAVETCGTGAGSVRMLAGSMDLHHQLEHNMAIFKGTEACLLLPSGYMANYALLTAITTPDDLVYNDTLNHASIIDGCRASGVTPIFFKHNDINNLERKVLNSSSDSNSPAKLIITDGVFSMDGDVAQLSEILDIAHRSNALVMVDDAHATGVIGNTGRGTAEYCGVLGKPDITVATLSKGLGAVGGCICASRAMIKYITNRSRAFLFTTALPPAVCGAALAALEIISTEPELRTRLHDNRKRLYEALSEIGYHVIDTPSAIVPVMVGEESVAVEMAARLENYGIFVNAVGAPAVPKRQSRLRLSVMATHTSSDLDQCVSALHTVGKEMKLI